MADRTHIQGSIGLLASRLMIRQPIVKDSSISGGGSPHVCRSGGESCRQSLPYYFYDVNAKIIYRPSPRDRLEISHYSGDDKLNYSRQPQDSARRSVSSNFTIANSSQTILWKRQVHKGLHSSLSFYHTKFGYNSQTGFEENRLFVRSAIEDVGGKWVTAMGFRRSGFSDSGNRVRQPFGESKYY